MAMQGTYSAAKDIDVSAEGPLKSDSASVWDLIGRMRDYKNIVFEAAITDLTRKLFE